MEGLKYCTPSNRVYIGISKFDQMLLENDSKDIADIFAYNNSYCISVHLKSQIFYSITIVERRVEIFGFLFTLSAVAAPASASRGANF